MLKEARLNPRPKHRSRDRDVTVAYFIQLICAPHSMPVSSGYCGAIGGPLFVALNKVGIVQEPL